MTKWTEKSSIMGINYFSQGNLVFSPQIKESPPLKQEISKAEYKVYCFNG